jgi:hypothetical protein
MGLRVSSHSIWTRYGFLWVTAAFFLISLAGHWVFAWFAYVQDQFVHRQPVEVSEFFIQTGRDTLENWQSEFLQLIWQVAGLALLLHVGSPQSKEGDDRMEAKIDAILLAVQPKKAKKVLAEIDEAYEGRHTDTVFVERLEGQKSK